MNLKLENKDDLDNADIEKQFLEYNSVKYTQLLSRFRSDSRKLIKTIPLFFHVNRNLLPGYVNDNVPHSVYNYLPDVEAVDLARSFNSKFDYDFNMPVQNHSIEAIYIQDNLKSGKLILWVIPHLELDASSIELLREKANRISRWLESIKIKLDYQVSRPVDMPLSYWGDKHDSVHPDKSIFLENFYSESILIAGKSPAWWLVPPDKENQYEELINETKISKADKFNTIIDFGSIANVRPQDYLASAIINLINIKYCPEETWLNILELCHKLASFPSLDSTSYRIKEQIHSLASDNFEYQDIYCTTINEIIGIIYGREKSILVTRTLKIIAFQHKTNFISANIYRKLLSNRQNNDEDFYFDDKLMYEFIPITEIIFNLISEAFKWFINKIEYIECNLMTPDSMLHTITNNLLRRIEIESNCIPVTNIHAIKSTKPYDVCIKHNITTHLNSWSIIIVDNEIEEIEAYQGDNPIALTAWGVFNRIIDKKTRLSVSCPYLSIKQTLVADISIILLKHLSDILTPDISLESLTMPESPIHDILIINADQSINHNLTDNIIIYRFCITNYGRVTFDEYKNMNGFLTFMCESLSSDLKLGKKAHKISLHSTNNFHGNAFITEARHIYNKTKNFIFDSRLKYTHFIDTTSCHYYAITKNNDKLATHYEIKDHHPEEHFKYTNEHILMYFSSDVPESKVLNYIYKNNVYEYLQVFYLIQDNSAKIYVVDENGYLARFSQPFYERQSFINQWIMFLYNARKRLESITENTRKPPNIEICELTYRYNGLLVKDHLNSTSLPKDSPYFDLKISIHGEKGKQSITLKCEDVVLTSAQHGRKIYAELRKYLSKNFRSGSRNPIYLTDIEAPLSQFTTGDPEKLHIRDYIRYKINIEKRLNEIINHPNDDRKKTTNN